MISFNTNNNQKIEISQFEHDDTVLIHTENSSGIQINEYEISNGDFIMLLNYYKYTKENNIQCDFINPSGKGKR